MMKCLKNKLKAKSGASLAATLLLFLVCAVIGSAVLTAASATSGRIAERRESDRRYYAVTSAAKLFAGEIEGQSVTFDETLAVTAKFSDTDGTPDSVKVEGTTFKMASNDGDSKIVKLTGDTYTFEGDSESMLKEALLEMYGKAQMEGLVAGDYDDISNLWTQEFQFQSYSPKVFTMESATSGVSTKVYGKLNVSMTGETQGTLEAVFSNVEIPSVTENLSANAYFVTVSCPFKVNTNELETPENIYTAELPATINTELTKSTTIEWGEAQIKETR